MPPVFSCFVTTNSPFGGFDDRETDVREIGNVLPVELAVSARTLPAAFDDVPGDRAGGDPVPIFECPAEFVHQRRER
jgi:hypothetical protein